jgi:hypothetical protein
LGCCHMGGARGGGAHGEVICGPGAPSVPGAPNDPGAPSEPGAPIEPGGPGMGIPGALPHDTVVFLLEMGVTTSSSSAASALEPSGCLSGDGERRGDESSRGPAGPIGPGPIGRAIALGMSVVDPLRACTGTDTGGAVGLANVDAGSPRGKPENSGGTVGFPLMGNIPRSGCGTSCAAGSRPGAPGGGGGVKAAIPG